MKLLLDTHTFIWWDREPDLIPAETLRLMRQAQLLLSLVSLWEIQIKTRLGKLNLNMPLADLVEHHQENGITLLAISLPHILALEQLPQHHRDPFDRLLIAQSCVESTAIVSRDAIFKSYDCQVVW
ncbi:type II toxin-antitoxin system VapC family toxin [Nodosilinea sp. LEGE 06152]|uniref:type II toxin-antitoxin system VapC family toxin n=1 Tax=Nodosilinea sp. LEGE 06152 TaxID=2777966 RepID=UPI001880388C|nr:type II toxin-antitoxin system VapC family toxin [Nodosilinea sp. LEGE 06152]MBE9159099.1 type II toxin-antitoxin system VapC family toxin [Nodosilinea sp. LEGE 06152]